MHVLLRVFSVGGWFMRTELYFKLRNNFSQVLDFKLKRHWGGGNLARTSNLGLYLPHHTQYTDRSVLLARAHEMRWGLPDEER